MGKIKVLHIELDEHLGGIESFLYNLYSEMDRGQVQFDFITRSDIPAKGDELRKLGANIYKVSSYKNPFKYLFELDKVITDGKYNVVHIHKNSAAVILPFLVIRKHNDIRVFVHSHNMQPSVGGITSIFHRINRGLLYKNADEHLACSQAAGKWMYGKDKGFTVLKNGILLRDYRFSDNERKNKRQELNISEDTFVIGNVGRFTEQKNQKRLVDIYVEFQKIMPDSCLIFVGDGALKQEIATYVSERNINNVMFLGVRNDVAKLMMAMDCFIMPSLYEGLPIAGIEAQAAGLDTYFASSISHETQLLDSVQWFDLKESDQEIAKKIKLKKIEELERKKRNDEVKRKGYDMEQTAVKLLRKYRTIRRKH